MKKILLLMPLYAGLPIFAQSAAPSAPPSVSQVIPYSQITTGVLQTVNAPGGISFKPTDTGSVRGIFSIYSTSTLQDDINKPGNYSPISSAVISALNANIASSLSLIPLSSPTSGVILRKDPLTGADLPGSSTLGPIFTQRAETVGKGKWYVGITYQDYHFKSLDGASLNGLPVLYKGGDATGPGIPTAPATLNMALDVRLSQELAFITYGVTNRFDVSVGLPSVHSAVAATSYNGIVYSGTGTVPQAGPNQCWCLNTLTPGSYSLARPLIGTSSLSKSGFGDLALRLKAQVIEHSRMSMAVGTDLRFPTGDEKNYLGTGTTSVKPFVAMSLYTKPFANGIVLAPHVDVGWQFSGKSILGGTLQQVTSPEQLNQGTTVQVPTSLVYTKGTLPDVLNWSAGTEVALNRRNTVVLDFIGNQIGMVNGIQTLSRTPRSSSFNPPQVGYEPNAAAVTPQSSGFLGTGLGSYGQYSGAFGYKVRVYRDLVASFQALVRFDNNGLTARFVPLFGLGYSSRY